MPIFAMRLKEFEGLEAILHVQDLTAFLSRLRQDYYSAKQIAHLNLEQELETWLKLNTDNCDTFFAVLDEKDDHAKNDDWGHYELYRCIGVRTADGKTHALKTLITKFVH